MSSILSDCLRNIERIVRMHARVRLSHSVPARGPQHNHGALNEEGATLVETALTFGVLMMTVLGLVQISLAVYAYHSISELAREATRYAIVRGSACVGLAGCDTDNAGIQQHLRTTVFPAIKSASLTTNTSWYSVTTDTSVTPQTAVIAFCGSGTPPAGCNDPGNQVRVQVIYKFPVSIPYLPATILTMSNTSAMIISQ